MRKYAGFAVLACGVFLAGPTLAGEPASDAPQTARPLTADQTPAPQSHPVGTAAAAEDPYLRPADKAAAQCGRPKPTMQPHAATSEDEYQGSPDWEVGEELC